MAKFVITKRKDGEYQFNLVASNGQTILTSEGYSAKEGCKNGIDSVRTNSQMDERFEARTSEAGKAFFVLKAANGQIIGTSQQYASEALSIEGVASVKNNAADAGIEDQS